MFTMMDMINIVNEIIFTLNKYNLKNKKIKLKLALNNLTGVFSKNFKFGLNI